MRYFHSSKSFAQYQPTESWWGAYKKKRLKKRLHIFSAQSTFNHLHLSKKEKKNHSSATRWVEAFFCLIVIWLILIFYLPFFRIKHITYSGLKIIKQDELEILIRETFLKKRWLLPYSNYFMVNNKEIEDLLRTKYAVNSIKVTKQFPGTLSIKLEEGISAVFFDNGTNYFLLDQNGSVIKKIIDILPNYSPVSSRISSTSTLATTSLVLNTSEQLNYAPKFRELIKEYGNYPILLSSQKQSIVEGQKNVLQSNFISALISLQQKIQEQKIGLVYYFTMERPESGVVVETNLPWKILIQPLDNVDEQLNRLKMVIKTNRPAEYVDVRFGDHVYWK